MDYPRNPETAPAERKIVSLVKDDSEEIKSSLLLHAALFLSLTAWFALKTTIPTVSPKPVPVRLVGPLSTIQPGSKAVGLPIYSPSALRPDSEKIPNLSPGSLVPKQSSITSRKKKSSQGRRVKKVFHTPRTPGKTERIISAKDPETPVVGQTPIIPESSPKPYVAREKNDEISRFSAEPASANPLSLPPEEREPGEPLEIVVLDEETGSPPENGVKSLSSAAGADGNSETGPSTMEVGGIESLGGGSERFEPPRIIAKVLPEYPEWARQNGMKGQAVYKVLIQESGNVGDVMTMSSTIDPKLAIIGSQALRRWVFTPVLIGGEPRETWVRITVQFALDL